MGEDQSIPIGSFRWVNKLRQTFVLEENKESKIIKGSIELKNKKHFRKINIKNNYSKLEIEDEIINTEAFEINWIFSNEIILEKLNENSYKIEPINYLFEVFSEEKLIIELKDNYYSKKYNEEILGKKLVIKSEESKKRLKVNTTIRKV